MRVCKTGVAQARSKRRNKLLLQKKDQCVTSKVAEFNKQPVCTLDERKVNGTMAVLGFADMQLEIHN